MTLLISYSGHFGGAERLLLDCASGLSGERVVACPEGPLAAAARRAGVRVIPLRERSLDLRRSARDRAAAPLRVAGHAREVRRLIRNLSPDLAVAWGMRTALACATVPGADRPPVLAFQHNDMLPSGAVARLVRSAARRFDRVIALSHSIAADLDPGGVLGDRLRVCHPGVDLVRFEALPPPDEPGEALLLGAIVDWKRPELALDAVAIAARELPHIRLRVAGAPLGAHGEDLLARLGARASEPDLAGRVELAGPVDAGEALRSASCLLHCADREPLGLVVLEALASARAVVAAADGGPAELVDDAVGRLYQPGDAASAAAALVELLGEPGLADRLGAEGRRRAEQRHGLPEAQRRWRDALGVREPAASPGAGEGLALVTVTHNSREELAELLASVERHLPAAHVVVADSGSSDESVPVARAWSGRVTVIELGANVGFGTASNRGLAAVTEPVAALVNPDVELLDDSLAALAREAARPGSPERLLAPLVLLPDGRRQDSVHPTPASPPDLARSLVPPTGLPGPLARRLDPWRAASPRRVGWAVGCCVVARTETLRRLGPFDEAIFLYGEDLDLGLRAADAGVETWFWPAARVLHRRAHASEREFGGEPFDVLAQRRREVVARNRGALASRIDDAAQALTFANRIALKRILRRPAEREALQLRALRRARRRRPAPGD
ncbi:MAG TPA: glycosyltransferase [Thermoleophilaceae bacterium]|nr:glycosyltransferase [Thermoleophilaceae bacterium]